jgi:para-aminobenzoate synthetase component 1
MLNWVQQFNIFCLFDNHQYKIQPGNYEYLLAAGVSSSIDSTIESFDSIDLFLKENKWVFGHLSYELGYSFQKMENKKRNKIEFPDFFFFKPQILIYIRDDNLYINCENELEVYNAIINESDVINGNEYDIAIQQRLTKAEYLQKIKALQKHIVQGDCYEINFCQEFYGENCSIDPAFTFYQLSKLSPNPFAAFYKLNDQYLICASPERFLVKQGDVLVSQPMKGTVKRILENERLDEKAKEDLFLSAKDRSENVMVVDMVRNDLSKVCREGTVKVDELYGVYSYPNIHQMISTVRGQLNKNILFSEIIAASFPMGSMTGAPKKKVMELIDEYEEEGRGLFSGCVGYIPPNGDFDFNVVIRSIFYNASNKYLSYKVGSGITFYSDAEKEWEECLLKGESIKKVLTS